jgi:hypothetical protein
MNGILDALYTLRATRITDVNVLLKELVTACRNRLNERSSELANTDAAAGHYATLLDGVALDVDTFRTLIKAVDEMDKLQIKADRVLEHVTKKLAHVN